MYTVNKLNAKQQIIDDNNACFYQQIKEVNAVWTGSEAQLLSDIDISVAVATDDGLITPIVKDAVNLGLSDISATVKVTVVTLIKFENATPIEFECYILA